MANDFFKNGDKAYSENLNDGVLVGNAFDWTVDISLPTDTGSVFPNSSTVVKAKVADVSITPNSNLSIGSTISNSSGSSQVYRLTVYPNFNRYGGFKSISVTASSGVTFYVANKGASTPIANNLDYSDLSSVPELKVLKEYDIVITIPSNKEVTGLEFVFQSSSASVSASLLQSNVTGLSDSLASKVSVSDIKDNLTSTDTNKPLSAKQGKALNDNKVDKVNGKGLSTNDFTESYKNMLDDVGWVEATVSNWSNATVYVNLLLRLVDFRYYEVNHSFTSTNESTIINASMYARVTTSRGSLDINIAPVMATPLASYNATIVGGLVNDTNTTKLMVQTTSTGTKTINLRGMWHY